MERNDILLIYYDWNVCDISGLPCVRGSKSECPKDETGISEYCIHFHVTKKTEDIER